MKEFKKYVYFFSYAFSYNPAIQPRCIVVMGSICKDVADTDVVQMLEVLAKVGSNRSILLEMYYYL